MGWRSRGAMDVDGSLTLAPDRPLPADDAAAGSSLRDELVAWLGANLTPEGVEVGQGNFTDARSFEILRAWTRLRADAGGAAISWPVEYGGREATVAEQLAYHEVMTERHAPG